MSDARDGEERVSKDIPLEEIHFHGDGVTIHDGDFAAKIKAEKQKGEGKGGKTKIRIEAMIIHNHGKGEGEGST